MRRKGKKNKGQKTKKKKQKKKNHRNKGREPQPPSALRFPCLLACVIVFVQLNQLLFFFSSSCFFSSFLLLLLPSSFLLDCAQRERAQAQGHCVARRRPEHQGHQQVGPRACAGERINVWLTGGVRDCIWATRAGVPGLVFCRRPWVLFH